MWELCLSLNIFYSFISYNNLKISILVWHEDQKSYIPCSNHSLKDLELDHRSDCKTVVLNLTNAAQYIENPNV